MPGPKGKAKPQARRPAAKAAAGAVPGSDADDDEEDIAVLVEELHVRASRRLLAVAEACAEG